MSKIVIPIANQYSYNNMPRNKDLNYNITNYCEHPNKTLLIDWKGDCFICLCEGWLPVTVGNIMDFNSLDEIWNSPTAKLLQDDINEKKLNRNKIIRKDKNLCYLMYLKS